MSRIHLPYIGQRVIKTSIAVFLCQDHLSQISSSVLFRLSYLNRDGAKICMISEHAPAFFLSQINQIHLNAPMIVMDGAGIYDANENIYLSTACIPPESSESFPRQSTPRSMKRFTCCIPSAMRTNPFA